MGTAFWMLMVVVILGIGTVVVPSPKDRCASAMDETRMRLASGQRKYIKSLRKGGRRY